MAIEIETKDCTALSDAELTEMFKPYALVRTVEGVDILLKRD